MEVVITNENFEKEVLKSTLPVLVDFWAPWCGPCTMLSPIVAEIAEENVGTLKVAKVNVDNNMELAMKYGISSIPALHLFKEGQVVKKSIGYDTKENIEAEFGI